MWVSTQTRQKFIRRKKRGSGFNYHVIESYDSREYVKCMVCEKFRVITCFNRGERYESISWINLTAQAKLPSSCLTLESNIKVNTKSL
jgi:hypothetical protein